MWGEWLLLEQEQGRHGGERYGPRPCLPKSADSKKPRGVLALFGLPCGPRVIEEHLRLIEQHRIPRGPFFGVLRPRFAVHDDQGTSLAFDLGGRISHPNHPRPGGISSGLQPAGEGLGVPLGEVSAGLRAGEGEVEHRGIRPQALEGIREAIAFQGPAVTRIGVGLERGLESEFSVRGAPRLT